MVNRIITILMWFSARTYPKWYRILTLMGASFFVIIFLPAIYWFFGTKLVSSIAISWPRSFEYLISIFCIPTGLALILWTFAKQYTTGRGSGSHMVPTRTLITTGLYRYIRHPMQLGAIIYYLGIETLVSSLTLGIVSALVTYITGAWFHNHIEDKILELKFGKDYLRYKKDTPALIPVAIKRLYTN